jgi:hypothetical protein
MGIPLQLGRDFTARDRGRAPRVAIVNDVFVNYFFKNENPIGRHFLLDAKEDIEIVGVVRHSKYTKVDEKESPRVVYLPFAQEPNPASLMLYAHTSAEAKTLFATLRREVTALDPALPINDLRTMRDQVDESLSAQRVIATLSAFFGILAMLLAALGLYGVMAYTVTRRTREIGIRLALGAGRGSLLSMVMREVALLTLAGVLIAIPIALALTRLIRAQLYGIVPNDPLEHRRRGPGPDRRRHVGGHIPQPSAPRESTDLGASV